MEQGDNNIAQCAIACAAFRSECLLPIFVLELPILPNSRVLWVTRIESLAKAIAAIIKSFGPMSSPRLSKSARIAPYTAAERSSNVNELNKLKNRFKRVKVRSPTALFAAPDSNSALTTEHKRISSGVSRSNRACQRQLCKVKNPGWTADGASSRDYLFADGHVKYVRAATLTGAQTPGAYPDGFPDPNVTPGGLGGADVP